MPFSLTEQICTERRAVKRAACLLGIQGHLVPELHSQVMPASEEDLLTGQRLGGCPSLAIWKLRNGVNSEVSQNMRKNRMQTKNQNGHRKSE